jgi:hypothetical protein
VKTGSLGAPQRGHRILCESKPWDKNLVSRVLLVFTFSPAVFTFLLSLACGRSSLLSYPLVVLISFLVDLVAL